MKKVYVFAKALDLNDGKYLPVKKCMLSSRDLCRWAWQNPMIVPHNVIPAAMSRI